MKLVVEVPDDVVESLKRAIRQEVAQQKSGEPAPPVARSYTAAEAAKLAGVSHFTILHHIQRGTIKASEGEGRHRYRISSRALKIYIKSRQRRHGEESVPSPPLGE